MKKTRLTLALLALVALPAFAAADPQRAQDPAPRNPVPRVEAENAVGSTSNPMPEGTLALASMGLLALGAARRRMKA